MPPMKSKLLNKVRALYRGTAFERAIARNSRQSGAPIWRSLAPNHDLYRPGERRSFVANGLAWEVDVSDYIGHEIYFGLDRSMPLLFQLAKPDSIVFDVGVNLGWSALNLAALCPEGNVIGFEPDPQNFANCLANLRRNNLPNLTIEPLGLGDRPRTASMTVEHERNRGGNRISEESGGEIRLTTIDEYCRDQAIPRLDLIKIDTEGFEQRIIQGGSETLARHRPALFIEVNDTHLARYGDSVGSLFQLLRELGYARFNVAGTATLIDDPDLLQGCHVDLIVR